MPKRKYYTLPPELKQYSARLRKLNQNVLEMKHYWKIRCAERKTLGGKARELTLLLIRMKHLEASLGDMLGRKRFTIKSFEQHKSKQNNQCYPLFINLNQRNRLLQFLKDKTSGKIVRPKNKVLFWLTRSEYNRMRTFIKKDRRKRL